jgi:hypothetical protein
MAPCHWTSARARQANHTLNSGLGRYEHFRAVRTYQIISIVFAELPKICALGPLFKKNTPGPLEKLRLYPTNLIYAQFPLKGDKPIIMHYSFRVCDFWAQREE